MNPVSLIAAKPLCYLPPLMHFRLMLQAGRFILADDLQFSSSIPMSRARIKTPQGAQWLSVPVLRRGGQTLREVRIDNSRDWRSRHWKRIALNYGYAPYFEFYDLFLQHLFEREWHFLLDFNLALLDLLCRALQIDTPLLLRSELGLCSVGSAGLREMLQVCNAGEYLADPADRDYIDVALLSGVGIAVRFLPELPVVYRQQFGDFCADLSILDLLFNEGPLSRDLLR